METNRPIPQEEYDRLRALLRVLAHELRTPLGTVLMQAQLLELELNRHPKAGKRVEGIVAACRQMARLLGDLTDMALAESGQLPLQRESVALPDFISRLDERVPGTLRLDRLQFDAAADLPPVSCDPDRLDSILVNLLGHVVDHSSGTAPVVVSLRYEADEVWVDIAAGTIGAAADPAASFGQFSRERSVPGDQGLKLRPYVAWLLARAHGGDLRTVADSAGGTSYRLSLPRA